MTDLDKRITDACHRIEELYYETEGHCCVSFSGGKDSTVMLALIKMCEDIYTIPVGGIPAVFSNTGIELGVTVDFVKWVKNSGWYSNVQIIRPEVSFDWVLKNQGKPMKSKMKSEMLHRWHRGIKSKYVTDRLLCGKSSSGISMARTKLADKDMHMVHEDFPIVASNMCCNYLKKKPLDKFAKANGISGEAMGIREAEEGTRKIAAQRRIKEGGRLCSWTRHNLIHKAPIIDWTDEDVEEFIEKYNVPLSEAYTKYGFSRTGCMACPFSRRVDHDLEYLFYHEPNRYKASMHWLKDVYIAQNVILPFDEAYERERERMWFEVYEPMRQEMLRKYRPNSKLIRSEIQMNIFQLD